MSDYTQDTSRDRPNSDRPHSVVPEPVEGNRTGLFIGIGAVALVVILGLVAFGGDGGDAIAPTNIPDGDPVGIPETVVPAEPAPVLE